MSQPQVNNIQKANNLIQKVFYKLLKSKQQSQHFLSNEKIDLVVSQIASVVMRQTDKSKQASQQISQIINHLQHQSTHHQHKEPTPLFAGYQLQYLINFLIQQYYPHRQLLSQHFHPHQHSSSHNISPNILNLQIQTPVITQPLNKAKLIRQNGMKIVVSDGHDEDERIQGNNEKGRKQLGGNQQQQQKVNNDKQ